MLSTAFVVVGALVAAWFVWPTSLGGCTTLTIISGRSMEPTYYTGDLVVARCGDPEIGEVIVYEPADVGGARVIHRVTGGDAASGWVMLGDNNDSTDPWTPSGDEVLGVAGLHVPGLGRLALVLLSPVLWVSLIVLAAGMLVWPGARARHVADAGPDVDDESVGEGGAVR